MRIGREIEPLLRRAARGFPAIVVSGPRRAGKTYCLRSTFPSAGYHLLEDPDVLARVKSDPRGFLESLRPPVILDEVQNAPELFAYVRTRVEAAPRRTGQWILTGSQDFALMEGVSETIAGRAAIFTLLPFSYRELGRWDLLRGGFPEVWARPGQAQTWFASYLQTYFERDVRSILNVRDLSTFRRFLTVLAARNGQVLNMSDMAAPLGVSVPTIGHWLGVLETTGLVARVPPYFENFEKRLIKSPRIYWLDTGLLCFLLGVTDKAALDRSPFVGAVFESFVASELLKNQANRGRPRELYFFRDQQGLEVDFLVPDERGGLTFIEAKWTRTPTPTMAGPIASLLPRVRDRLARGIVVHRSPPRARKAAPPVGLVPGVEAVTIEALLARLVAP